MKASIGALLIGLGSAGAAWAQPIPASSAIAGQPPSATAQPGGARFFGPSNSYAPAAGPFFQGGSVPIPPLAAANSLMQKTPSAGSPLLPAPLPAPADDSLPLPKFPPPFVAGPAFSEPMEVIPGGPLSDPLATTAQTTSNLPALGPWGAGVDSSTPGPHLWMTADYLLWFVKNGPMPTPLVVTGSETDDFPGALDQLNTTVLYGGKDINFNLFSGARLSVGLWGGPDHRYGFEMSAFILEQKAAKYTASGGASGNPYLARPFINAQSGAENVYFISQNFSDPTRSAFMTGNIDISNSSRLWSWETNALWNVWRGPSATANLIGGFRSVGLRERFNVLESLSNLQDGGGAFFGGSSIAPGTSVATYDKFDAENTFYGGQIGARMLLQQGRFSLNVTAKAAVGVMQQLMKVDGGTVWRSGTPGSDGRGLVLGAASGGVLAQTTNMGRHFQNKFAVVPEGALDFCWDVTDRLVVKLGYTFVYVSSVARPGEQVDRTINPGYVPTDFDYGTGGVARPSFKFTNSSVWTQGANLGLEFRY